MKKINKYLFGAFAALLTAGLFSCVEEAPEYVPGAPDQAGCYAVYFPTQEASGEHTFDPTMPKKVTVIVSRDSLKSASNPLPEINVPLKAKASEEGIFTVPESVHFADGQSEVAVDVTFPDNVKVATKYSLALTIEDPAYASTYSGNANFLEFSVFCVEWRYFAVKDGKETFSLTEDGAALVTFNQTWWDETAWGYVKYYEVDNVRTCQTVTIKHLNGDGENTNPGFFGSSDGSSPEWTFTWYPKQKNNIGGQLIDLDLCVAWHHSSYDADVYVADWRHYWNDINSNHYGFEFLDFAKKYGDPDGSYPVSYYDGNGGFYFYIRSYYMFGVGGWGVEDWDNVGIADGFTRVDYSIDIEAYETVDGVAPVEFTLGADVATVKYAVAEGELTAKEAGKIIDGINDAEGVQTIAIESTDTIVGVSPAASGIYTIVAVSFDAKGNAQESAYTSFTFVAAEDAESYAATFSIGIEPVSTMYTHLDYDGTNSIQYFMYGSGLTAAKIGVYETATVEKYGADVCADALEAVDADVLAAINGNGYNTVEAGLNPLTSYTVVAWATNNYNSKVETIEFVTEGVPYYPTVEEVIGTYVYEGTSYWAGNDETDTLVIAASDNAELGNVMFTTIFGIPCEKNVYATIDTENSTITIKDEQPFLHSDQYDGEIYFMINGADEVSMKFIEEGHFNSPSAYFGYYVIGSAATGWFNCFTAFDAKKVEEGSSVIAKRTPSFKTYFNETLKTKVVPVGKKTDIRAERNPQTVAFKVVKAERPARSTRFSAPVKMENIKF